MRIAAESDCTADISRKHNMLLMTFSMNALQKVCYLNLDIHGRAENGAKGTMNAHAEKLVRDAIIWTHIAGDAVQRMKAVQALL